MIEISRNNYIYKIMCCISKRELSFVYIYEICAVCKEDCDLFKIPTIINSKFWSDTCKGCTTFLSMGYSIILYKLKQAGYLREDYPALCCSCYNKQQNGNRKYDDFKRLWEL